MSKLISAKKAKAEADSSDYRRRAELLGGINDTIKKAAYNGQYKTKFTIAKDDSEFLQTVLEKQGYKVLYDTFGAILYVEWGAQSRDLTSIEEKVNEFEHRLLELTHNVVNAKLIQYERPFSTDPTMGLSPVTVRCYLFTEDGSRIEADIELSPSKTEELFEEM